MNEQADEIPTQDESLKYLTDRLRTALADVTDALEAVATMRGSVNATSPTPEPGSELYVEPGNIIIPSGRPGPTPECLFGLAVSLKQRGQGERVPVVRPDPDQPGRFRLIHGRTIYEAMKMLRKDLVRVVIADED